ncbi:MAG TPA: GGDEF domain-containing protein [Streptosporangiaceae bacterium]
MWGLRPHLRSYVIVVDAAALIAIGVAAAFTHWRARDAVLYALLTGLGAITVEASRRLREPAGASKDAHGLWLLAIAIMLPPFYVMTAPIVAALLTQWRVRQTLPHRRVFSAAAVGLGYGAASVIFHAVWAHPSELLPDSQTGLLAWGLLGAACAIIGWLASTLLVATAIRLDDPATRIGDLLGGPASLGNDAAELCVGVLIAFCVAISPILLLFALPCAVLLQHSARQAQLGHASQTDALTGLLSPVAWRQEAAVRVARAVRSGAPQAVALVHIDQRTGGQPAGHSQILREIAKTLATGTGRYDLAGRFGREELVILLARTGGPEALCIADLLRARISELAIPASPQAGHDPHVTVSIGVAALGDTITDLTDLLTAADAALYWAKRSGCNSVRLAGRPPAGFQG